MHQYNDTIKGTIQYNCVCSVLPCVHASRKCKHIIHVYIIQIYNTHLYIYIRAYIHVHIYVHIHIILHNFPYHVYINIHIYIHIYAILHNLSYLACTHLVISADLAAMYQKKKINTYVYMHVFCLEVLHTFVRTGEYYC